MFYVTVTCGGTCKGTTLCLSEVTVPRHESQRSCICVLEVYINGLSEMLVPCHESKRSCMCVLEAYINGFK